MLRVTLVCVGRLKAGAERDLATRYLDRAAAAGRAVGLGFELREIDESPARRTELRKLEEAKAIRASVGVDTHLVVLDERGVAIDSVGFSTLIGAARDDGAPALSLVIGGPDGLDPELRQSAHRAIAFGAMTWPHQLVRIMAAEQLYRAVTILSGHPYHRA